VNEEEGENEKENEEEIETENQIGDTIHVQPRPIAQ
jgi:hypothetical protein